MLDGTYLQDWCLLIAYDGHHVIDWCWADQEKAIAWAQILSRWPAPAMTVTDGGTGMKAALAAYWPHTAHQRCYFHIRQAVIRQTTRCPKLACGQQILALTQALMQVRTRDQAADWISRYSSWETSWNQFLAERSTSGQTEQPAWVRPGQTWWYTHQSLRRVRGLYRGLIKGHNLFCWLEQTPPGPRTISPLEGGINAAVKRFCRTHRGLANHHVRTGVDLLLNQMSQHPYNTWTLAKQALETPDEPIGIHEPNGPETFDHNFSWEDGNGIRKGWAGR